MKTKIKIGKSPKSKKKSSKKNPKYVGPRTIDPICFHKDGVNNQRKKMYKKKVAPELSLRILKLRRIKNNNHFISLKLHSFCWTGKIGCTQTM